MKNKNIFRMTSVLLISILCVCGLSLNAYASDGGEYYTEPNEETTTPPVIVIPAESEDNEQTDEQFDAYLVYMQTKGNRPDLFP